MKHISFSIVLFIILFAGKRFYNHETELIFSHKFHANEVGTTCSDCHSQAMTSSTPTDNLLPAMETCYNCHDEDETECSVCHSNEDEPAEVPRIVDYIGHFSHQTHGKSGKDCLTCHKEINEKKFSAKGVHLPSNQVCTSCHVNADYADEKERCLECHQSDFRFIPVSHNILWKQNHGIESEINASECSHCHQENYCVSCHEGDNLNYKTHPLNYRTTHGLWAKANKENCLTCHQEQAFCIDCHRNESVMPRNHNFANWSNTTTGGKHAKAGLFDFDNCLSCHNNAYTDLVCTNCHL